MSCSYYIVDPERVKNRERIESVLNAIRDMGVEMLGAAKFVDGVPVCDADSEIVDDAVEAFAGALNAVRHTVNFRDDGVEVGVRTAIGFRWNVSDGFSSLAEVDAYLREHPGVELRDEYGKKFSMGKFAEEVLR